ncbi:hypothetical protein E2562_030848 [Oryza meyeriana var. granulata]|uniref:Uncharacterized protein n=1 Tax=Oryza meyeriana var. granulata TaxID=110450 RepID=A0A6G1F005_9ORYZ|nr:hypothetical protein E2562_030848 [Oryza meyeriana var. granulata]
MSRRLSRLVIARPLVVPLPRFHKIFGQKARESLGNRDDFPSCGAQTPRRRLNNHDYQDQWVQLLAS